MHPTQTRSSHRRTLQLRFLINSAKVVGVKTHETGKEFIMDPNYVMIFRNVGLTSADSVLTNLEGEVAVASALSAVFVLAKMQPHLPPRWRTNCVTG